MGRVPLAGRAEADLLRSEVREATSFPDRPRAGTEEIGCDGGNSRTRRLWETPGTRRDRVREKRVFFLRKNTVFDVFSRLKRRDLRPTPRRQAHRGCQTGCWAVQSAVGVPAVYGRCTRGAVCSTVHRVWYPGGI